jgi:hypothetical protein
VEVADGWQGQVPGRVAGTASVCEVRKEKAQEGFDVGFDDAQWTRQVH